MTNISSIIAFIMVAMQFASATVNKSTALDQRQDNPDAATGSVHLINTDKDGNTDETLCFSLFPEALSEVAGGFEACDVSDEDKTTVTVNCKVNSRGLDSEGADPDMIIYELCTAWGGQLNYDP